MELKYLRAAFAYDKMLRFNRTFMELKWRYRSG